MNCSDSKLWLHADLDGELNARDSVELRRHLKTCAECAGEEQFLRSLKAALRQSQLRYDAPASLHEKIQGFTRKSDGDTQSRFNPLLLWKSIAFAASAIAIFTILLRPKIPEADTIVSQAVDSHVRSLQAQHLTDVASSDQHTVKPWFNGKLDFAPDVKDFASQGFPLVGGRLDYVNGRTVAALVYQRNKHFINVLIWPSPDTNAAQKNTAKRNGYSVVSQNVNGLHHCFVSDLDENTLEEFARFSRNSP